MAHPNIERVRERLREQGIETQPVEFAESTRTSADAAAAIGTTVAQIAKSLVFMADGQPVLVIACGANRVDTKKLGALLDARITRADADTVRQATGFPIGGVPPVAHATPLRTLIDEDLLAYPSIWAAAGTPNAVFETTPADLVKMTSGQVADLKEPPKE
ncbi:MAG TPA: YbaK/EbsC family protein [Ktedonobacterales bacterium]|nr:YbaK/EbsC family protein [Ktedonobacterales bacterium]